MMSRNADVNDSLSIIPTDACDQRVEQLKTEEIIPIYAHMSKHVRSSVCKRLEEELKNGKISPIELIPIYSHMSEPIQEFMYKALKENLEEGLRGIIKEWDFKVDELDAKILAKHFMMFGNDATHLIGILQGHKKDDTKLNMHYEVAPLPEEQAVLFRKVGRYFFDNKDIIGILYDS